MGAVN